jgi:hypothetical protein
LTRGSDGAALGGAPRTPAQRPVARLFFEAYAASLRGEPGPWQDFARRSIQDWLDQLCKAQPGVPPETARVRATRTLAAPARAPPRPAGLRPAWPRAPYSSRTIPAA